MEYILEDSWSRALAPKFDKEYKQKLFGWLNEEYANKTIYPAKDKIFNALNLVPIDKVKVVIIGQDPYHTEGQAHGLAFSCFNGTAQPSLKNIYKEIQSDLGISMSDHTNLTAWANQGVLLLNTSLTVVAHQPASHSNELWHCFTKKVIEILNAQNQPIVFMLWGNHAKSFLPMINNPNHLILQAAHPSPFSAYNGFFGCRHFSKCNEFLIKHNIEPINWQI